MAEDGRGRGHARACEKSECYRDGDMDMDTGYVWGIWRRGLGRNVKVLAHNMTLSRGSGFVGSRPMICGTQRPALARLSGHATCAIH